VQKQLSEGAKQDLAFALTLLKDFKSQGDYGESVNNITLFKYVWELADFLGIKKEFDDMLSKVPPMKILEKHPQ
jgi:hypothetical protein